MRASEQKDLQWLMQEVEKAERDIRSIYRELLPYDKRSEAPPATPGISELWCSIAAALRNIGLDEIVIQTFDQAMEDFQKGTDWAKQAIDATDPYRPLASWSLERLCRAQRRIISVSASVSNRVQLIQTASKGQNASISSPQGNRNIRTLRVAWPNNAFEGIDNQMMKQQQLK